MAKEKSTTGAIKARNRFALFAAAIALLLGSLTIGSNHAWAQSDVAPRSQIVKFLSKRFAEMPAAHGLAHDGILVEVFKSLNGSTWTLVLTRPNGMSQVMVSGQVWIDVEPKADARPISRVVE